MRSADMLMRAANPVPDPAMEFEDTEIDALLLLIRAGSTHMDSDTKRQETTGTQAPIGGPNIRGPLVAAAAFAVVIGLVGVVWLINNDADDAPVTDAPVTPTTQAAPITSTSTTVAAAADPTLDEEAFTEVQAFIDEINSGDFAASGERIAQAGQFDLTYLPDVEQDWVPYAQGMYEYWTHVDSRLSITECRTLTSGVTRCEIARNHHEIFTTEPEDFILQIRLAGDAIAFISQVPVRPSGYWNARQDFDDWLYAETAGQDDNESYNLWFFYDKPKARAELVQTYAQQWVDAGSPAP